MANQPTSEQAQAAQLSGCLVGLVLLALTGFGVYYYVQRDTSTLAPRSKAVVQRFFQTLQSSPPVDGPNSLSPLFVSNGWESFLKDAGARNADEFWQSVKNGGIQFSLKSKFYDMSPQEKQLPGGGVERIAYTLEEANGVEPAYALLRRYNVAFQRTSPTDEWKISRLTFDGFDYTVTNTHFLYRLYFYYIVISGVGVAFSILGTLFGRRRYIPPTQLHLAAASGPGLFWVSFIFLLPSLILRYIWPQIFTSHLGLFWTLSFACGLCNFFLQQDNVAYHYCDFPGLRLLTALFIALPVALFFGLPQKFVPVQSSPVKLEFISAQEAEVATDTVLTKKPGEQASRESRAARRGEKFPVVQEIYFGGEKYVEVVAPGLGRSYLPINAVRLHTGKKEITQESDYISYLIELAESKKQNLQPQEEEREIARAYFQQGIVLNHVDTLRDYVNALNRYNEALEYDGTLRVVYVEKGRALLQTLRILAHDNWYNPYSVFTPGPISYNKLNALGVGILEFLGQAKSTLGQDDELSALEILVHLYLGNLKKARELVAELKGDKEIVLLARLLTEPDLDRAREMAEELVRKDPDQVRYLVYRGMLNLHTNKQQARTDLERALSMSPQNVDAVLYLGATYEGEDPSKVSSYYAQALQVEINYPNKTKLFEFLTSYTWQIRIVRSVSFVLMFIYLFSTSVKVSVFGTLIKLYLVITYVFIEFAYLFYFRALPVKGLVEGILP